jgi:hypothetical protein
MIINNKSDRQIFYRLHPRSDRHGVGLTEGVIVAGASYPYQNPRFREYAVDLRRDWAMGDPIQGWNTTVSWDCTGQSIIDVGNSTVSIREPAPGSTPTPPPPGTGVGVLNMSYSDIHVAFDWLGVLQEATEEPIKPGQTFVFGASRDGFHNVTIVPAWVEGSEMTPARWDEWNERAIAELTVSALGTALAAGSVVVSFGMTAPALAGTAAVLSKGLAAASAVQTISGFMTDAVSDVPVAHQLKSVRGSSWKTFIVVRGGRVFGEMSEGRFQLQAVSPLTSTVYGITNPLNHLAEVWKEYTKTGVDRHSTNVLWRFHQGKDSPENDTAQTGKDMDVATMKALAARDPGVVAFNTNGWFKDTVVESSRWRTWSNDPNEGLWVKAGVPPASLLS